jgi:hypothetical protein
LRTVLRDRLVSRAISRTVLFWRWCIRRTLPIMAMVITPAPRCPKEQQGRLNTRVKFGSAQPLQVGQFSVGGNRRTFKMKQGGVAAWPSAYTAAHSPTYGVP